MVIFLLLNCKTSFYILDTNLLSDKWFANISHCFMGCHFTFFKVSFEEQRFFTLMKSNLLILLLVLLVWYLKSIAYSKVMKIYSYVFLWEFYSFGFTFRFLIQFELIFVYDVRHPKSFFCTWLSNCPSKICWKDYSVSHWIIFTLLSKISWP